MISAWARCEVRERENDRLSFLLIRPGTDREQRFPCANRRGEAVKRHVRTATRCQGTRVHKGRERFAERERGRSRLATEPVPTRVCFRIVLPTVGLDREGSGLVAEHRTALSADAPRRLHRIEGRQLSRDRAPLRRRRFHRRRDEGSSVASR